MKYFKTFSALLMALLFVTGCSKNSEVGDANAVSPFEKFIGTWHLEERLFDGEPTNKSDSVTTGYFQFNEQLGQEDAIYELTSNENEIIIDMGSLSLICTYRFIDDDTLELDDSTDMHSDISTWIRQ